MLALRYICSGLLLIFGGFFILISVVLGTTPWHLSPMPLPGLGIGTAGIFFLLQAHKLVLRVEVEPLLRGALLAILVLGVALLPISALISAVMIAKGLHFDADNIRQLVYSVVFGLFCLGAFLYSRREGDRAVPK